MGSQLIPLAIQVLVIFTYRALQPKSINENMYGIQPADSANMSHVNLVVPPLAGTRSDSIPMRICRLKMLTQLAGLNRFQIQPATFARSAAHAQ